MKKSVVLFASAVLLLAGCQKAETISESQLNGGDGEYTFSVSVPDTETKAVADSDGVAAHVNHWVMEVLDADGARYNYQEEDGEAGVKTHSFTVRLVKGQVYTVLFWADTKDTYNVDSLEVVKLANQTTYSANLDSRDAFSAFVADFHTEQATTEAVTLKRAVSQMNIIFTDLKGLFETMGSDSVEYAKFKPVSFKAEAKVPTTFNVRTQEAGAPATSALTITADGDYLDNYDKHREKETLFMDYFFSSADQKDLVDIDFSFTSKGVEISHSFTSVPFQRNYRTNIIGELMSSNATWNIEVDPVWFTPDIDVTCVTVDTPAEAKTALQIKANTPQVNGEEAVVKVTEFTESADNYELVIPDAITKTNTPGVTFEANNVPAGKTLIVTDETIGGNCEYEGNVTLVTDAENVVVKTSKAHFELVGNAKVVYASTSDNTVVISKGYTVDSLIVEKGNVAVRGTVKSIRRGDNNPDDITYVDIYRSGKWENEENEQSKILIARHPSFVIGTEVYCSLQDAFNSTKDGDVIVLANDVNIATATINKAINVTLDLAGSTMTVENNNGDGLIISGGATLNLTNSIADKGTFVFKTNSSRNDGIYVYNTKEGETTTLNIQEPVKIVCETTSQNSSAHAEATAGKAAINLHEGAEFHVSSKSGSQVTAIMVGKYSEFNMDGGLFDMDVEFSSYSTNNDVVGVVLYGYPTATNAVNISGGEFNIGGKCAFAQGVQLSYYNGSNPGNVVNISGGEINLTENAGGKSYAFTMVSNGTYNITGGKVTATTPDDAELFEFQWSGSNRIISITGGEFFKKPADNYIPFGYAANEKDGVWVVDADSSLVYKEDGQSFGPGIVIGDIIWAPVNCGESVEEGGLFYQWGRKDGQTKGELAPEQISSSQVSNPADAQPNVFYKNDSNWYSGTDKLWNDGSEAVLEKAACDPCPDGWRMASYAELATLYVSFVKKAGYYSYVTDNGQTLSFPAVGCRQGSTGKTIDSPFSNYAFFWGGKFAEGKLWYWMIYDQQKPELIADDTAGKSDALPVRCVKFK